MCSPNVEYQRINPTTQALVTSTCVQTCENATDIVIQWNVYRGFQTGYPNNDIQWILFTNMDAYENILFFGKNQFVFFCLENLFFKGRSTKNITVANQLFLNNPTIEYWKFESVYTVTSFNGIATGAGAIRFTINSPPQNGTCNIDQTTGTTMSSFQITCSNWVDSDGVNGYSFYGRSIE
jgi:hypothetical protein